MGNIRYSLLRFPFADYLLFNYPKMKLLNGAIFVECRYLQTNSSKM